MRAYAKQDFRNGKLSTGGRRFQPVARNRRQARKKPPLSQRLLFVLLVGFFSRVETDSGNYHKHKSDHSNVTHEAPPTQKTMNTELHLRKSTKSLAFDPAGRHTTQALQPQSFQEWSRNSEPKNSTAFASSPFPLLAACFISVNLDARCNQRHGLTLL